MIMPHHKGREKIFPPCSAKDHPELSAQKGSGLIRGNQDIIYCLKPWTMRKKWNLSKRKKKKKSLSSLDMDWDLLRLSCSIQHSDETEGFVPPVGLSLPMNAGLNLEREVVWSKPWSNYGGYLWSRIIPKVDRACHNVVNDTILPHYIKIVHTKSQ